MTARRADLEGLPNWPLLLSREMVAAFLSIHPDTVDDWVEKKLLPEPTIRRRSCVRWDRRAIEQALSPSSGTVANQVTEHDLIERARNGTY